MSLMEIFLIGIGLSMDAFAVAICKGLSMQKVDLRYTVWIALYFGVFQAAMPLTGWLLGSQFARHVTRFAPWIAFILLALIGGNMIRESLSKDEEEAEREEGLTVDHKELLMLAVATSIDALAVGVSFSMVEISISIGAAVILIGCTTFVISLAGVFNHQSIGIAVGGDGHHPLHVAAGLALAPDLLTAAAPEHGATFGNGEGQRLSVHVREGKHLFGVVILHDGRDQALFVKFQFHGRFSLPGWG